MLDDVCECVPVREGDGVPDGVLDDVDVCVGKLPTIWTRLLP